MKNARKWYIGFGLFFSILWGSTYASITPVNPQPGQNLWHIAAAIGTELDQITALMNSNPSCCATTFTALQHLDNDALTVSSKVDALTNIINLDFNGTFTALAAGFGCGATPLYQSNVVNGAIVLTTSCASYCLAQCITGSIIIAASNVTVDLNAYSLLGTFSVLGSTANATIQNGNIIPPAPANAIDAADAGIFIAPSAQTTAIKNCRIECAATVFTAGNGRDGIDNGGTNTVIDNCFVQAGSGATTSSSIVTGMAGVGISNTGSYAKIQNSTIILSNPNNTFLAYVGGGNGNVTSFNTTTSAVGTTIPVTGVITSIVISPDGQTAYTASANQVVPINLTTNTAGTPITGIGDPLNMVITPDGKTLYVISDTPQAVYSYNLVTHTAGGAIGGTNMAGISPFGIAITPDGKTVYVTDANNSTVIPINVLTNTAGTPLTGFSSPRGITISPDGKTAYVANLGTGTVTPINLATNTVGTAITGFTSPFAIAITPDGTTAYVLSVSNSSVTPVTLATNTVGAAIPVSGNPQGIAITPDGKTAFVTNSGSTTVTPITIATNTAGAPISGFNAPISIAIATPNGGTGIIQNGTNGKIINNVVIGKGNLPSYDIGNGIMVSSSAGSTTIQDCTVMNCYEGYSLLNTATVQMSGCVAQSCGASGVDINGAINIQLIDCTAQACAADGFRGENNCTSCAVEHCTANNNLVSGFNFLSAGSCCSVGDSFAISNGGYGYLGNGTNTTFYNNFANCNTTNFDNFSASSLLGGCAQITLSPFSTVNGSIILNTPGASYCLSQNITGNIVISASNITLDLNQYSVIGTIEVAATAVNVIVRNGSVNPAGPVNSTDAATPAIRVDSLTNYTLLEDLYVLCANTNTSSGLNGRDGIDNFGNNTIIQRCVIQTGTGDTGGLTVSGSSGGTGIASTGSNAQLLDCTITTGAGGNGGSSPSTITGGAGGNGGVGINSSGANVQISNCMILTGAGGVGGANTNNAAGSSGGAGGSGGNGIISSSLGALIENCTIRTGSGAFGGNIASSGGSTTSIPGAGGIGGTGISASGSQTAILGCTILAGAGGNGGTPSTANQATGKGGAGGAGINFTSALALGCVIKSCVIRVSAGGVGATANSTLANTLASTGIGGNGGDGIITLASVDLITQCDIAGAASTFNSGGSGVGFNAANPGARGGHGIYVPSGGAGVSVIENCTISSLGAGGALVPGYSNANVAFSLGNGGNGINVAAPVGIIKDCVINSLGNGGSAPTTGTLTTGGNMTGGSGGNGINASASIGVIENCLISGMGSGGAIAHSSTTASLAAIGGTGGAGINSTGAVRIIKNCKISNAGAGGNASGGAISTGGIGGAGISLTFGSTSIENCTIEVTGNGGTASGATTSTGGAGGAGISTGTANLIKNCSILATGAGGTGTTTGGAGGVGVIGTGFNLVKGCVVETTGAGAATGGVGGIGFNDAGGSNTFEDCTVHNGAGDAFRATTANNTFTRCVATYCTAGTGFNCTNAGTGNTVERCLASRCNNGFIGSTTANNAVFFLDEASKNTTANFSGLGTNSAGNSGGAATTGIPASQIFGSNYGANLYAT